jgi:hypothetical protein
LCGPYATVESVAGFENCSKLPFKRTGASAGQASVFTGAVMVDPEADAGVMALATIEIDKAATATLLMLFTNSLSKNPFSIILAKQMFALGDFYEGFLCLVSIAWPQ